MTQGFTKNYPIDTDIYLSGNSQFIVPSQNAVKTYVDTASSNASVISKVLTGFTAGAGTVSASDTILQAFQKVVGNANLATVEPKQRSWIL